MNRTLLTLVTLLALIVLLGTDAPADDGTAELASKGHAFLKKYCHQCHGGASEEEPGLLVLDRETLIRPSEGQKPSYVVPGKPEASFLWIRTVKDKGMPPEYADSQPSETERNEFTQWIKAGAPFPRASGRSPVASEQVLTAIRDHLRKVRPTDRIYQRYFSLVHLHNNPTVSDEQMRLYRAAVSKLINSLSWQRDIVVPVAVDPSETILHLDIRKVGWHEGDTWQRLVKNYPYGVLHGEDQALSEIESEIKQLSGSPFASVRGDWFVVTASRAPKYDAMLNLPKTLKELERDMLKVNLEENFIADNLVRAAFNNSKVSRHNRLVERHPTPFGAYWRSYDFGSSAGLGNLVRFPLGPKFGGHPFPQHAFAHDGGEVIFNLPNGMQGYMLADAADNRLDIPAPIQIVRDLRETGGTPEVLNGVSCMSCHKHGMVTFTDVVRQGTSLSGAPRRKVEQLYPPEAEMADILAADERRFMTAVDQACGPFLRVGEDRNKSLHLFEEPIAEICRLYSKDLAPEAVAAELGLTDVAALEQLVRSQPRMQELGMRPLLQNEPIKRELWEARGMSLFHQVISEIGLTPNLAF